MDIHWPLLCISLNFSWFSKKLRPFMTIDGIKNLFRLWKIKGKIKFTTWEKHEYYNFDCSFLRRIKKEHDPCLKTNLATFIWFLEKWHYLKESSQEISVQQKWDLSLDMLRNEEIVLCHKIIYSQIETFFEQFWLQ